MNVYIIEKEDNLGNIKDLLEPYAKVIVLSKKGEDISKYTQPLKDQEEKILAVAPGLIDWKLPNEYLDKIQNLKGIATKSSWAHFIDLKYCKEKNIEVANSPGANSQSVAEYAIWQMLSLAKKLPLQLDAKFKTASANKYTGTEIKEKTAGIIGLGRVGSRIADMAKGLGMHVIYWNRSKKKTKHKSVSLNKLLKESDFIFKCVEICKETNKLLNRNNLKLLKKQACVISVFGGLGWGGKDDFLLLDMAEKGRIAGFSIENEHKKGTKIKSKYKGNVFIPAALAWNTKETHERYNQIWADGIIGVIKKKNINRVN